MSLGSLDKTSKIIAMLCICIAVVMGVVCQLHAAPHTHAIPAEHHQQDVSSSTVDDFSCVTAVIPTANICPVFLFLMLYVLLPILKALGPAFELDIPPRHFLHWFPERPMVKYTLRP